MGRSPLYLDRRAHPRVPSRLAVRFVSNIKRPLHLGHGLTQDLSLGGLQMLSAAIPERNRTFDIWIPARGDEVLAAKARTVWCSVEDSLGDSSYWVLAGLEMFLPDAASRRILSEVIHEKNHLERGLQESAATKIGYIF